MLELPFSTRLFWEDILEAQKRTAQIGYERYGVHTDEKDVIRAGIDSWVVELVGSQFSRITAKDLGFLSLLKSRGFPFRDLVIDTSIIVGVSVVLTFLVVRKILLEA